MAAGGAPGRTPAPVRPRPSSPSPLTACTAPAQAPAGRTADRPSPSSTHRAVGQRHAPRRSRPTPARSGSRWPATSTSRASWPPGCATPPPRSHRRPRALAAADLAIVNLETSVGTGGRPEPGKRFTFSAGPAAFEALAAAGVDVATHGQQPRAGLRPGPAPQHAAGRRRGRAAGTRRCRWSASAATPTRRSRPRSSTSAAPSSRRSPRPSPTRTPRPTRPATGRPPRPRPASRTPSTRPASSRPYAGPTGRADVVVAYLHWGIQGERCPSADQRSLAARPGRRGRRHRRRHPRPPAAGRRPARQRLRRLRPGQLRVVLPRRRHSHRRAHAHRAAARATGPGAPEVVRAALVAGAHRRRRAGRARSTARARPASAPTASRCAACAGLDR